MDNDNIKISLEPNDDKPKKGGGKILIVLIIIILLGICVAVVVPSLLNKEEPDKKETVEENKETPKELTKDSAIVKDLFEFVREDKNEYDSKIADDLEYKEYYEYYFTLRSLKDDQFKMMNCSSLSEVYVSKNDTSGEYMYAVCGDNDNSFEMYNDNGEFITGTFPTQEQAKEMLKDFNTYTISASIFDTQHIKYFGKDVTEKKSFENNPASLWYYDSKNDVYALFSTGSGDFVGGGYDNQEIDSIKVEGNKLSIITKATLTEEESKDIITYEFEKESDTGNYIFKNRESKTEE